MHFFYRNKFCQNRKAQNETLEYKTDHYVIFIMIGQCAGVEMIWTPCVEGKESNR